MSSIYYLFVILSVSVAVCYSNPLLSIDLLKDNNQTNEVEGGFSTGIIGGRHSKISRHPYQVAILVADNFVGSGIIIDKRHIVTTANLVITEDKINIKVAVGNSNYHKGNKHGVKRIKFHPKFSNHSLDHDIAVLQLSKKIRYSKNVKKISIGKKTLKEGTVVSLTGWGDKSDKTKSHDKREFQTASLNIISKHQCKKELKHYRITDTMICGLRRYVSPCWNDFGDAIVSKGHAYGLFSWKTTCNYKSPSVFTDLAAQRHWIRSTIKSNYAADSHFIAKRSPISFLDDNVIPSNIDDDINYMVETAIAKDKLEENDSAEDNQVEINEAIEKEENEEEGADEKEREQEKDENEKEREAIKIVNDGLSSNSPNALDLNSEVENNRIIKFHPLRRRKVNSDKLINKDYLVESVSDDNKIKSDITVDKDAEDEKEAEETLHDEDDPNTNSVEASHEDVSDDDEDIEVVDADIDESQVQDEIESDN